MLNSRPTHPKHETSSLKAHTETKAQATRRRKQPARDTLQGASLFDFTDEAGQGQVVPTTEHREVFDTSPRPFLSALDSHLRDGSIVVQKGQAGYLSDLKRRPTMLRIKRNGRSSTGSTMPTSLAGGAELESQYGRHQDGCHGARDARS